MENYQSFLNLIEKEIKKLDFKIPPYELYKPLEYILSIGGKRIRPVLLLMACNLFDDDYSKALKAALGIEMFHNFTLLHDDIMDDADMRRKQETVHVKWDVNTAILSGDALAIKAYQYVSESETPNIRLLLKVFNKTALEVCEGQQYDMNFETSMKVSEQDYLEMIRLKTAVLLAGSLQMGAIIADASERDQKIVYDFGVHLGLGFQIQDDYLDTFGDEKVFGKTIGGDIVSNKKTYLLIRAMEKADETQKNALQTWMTATDFDPAEKTTAVKQIYTALEIPAETRSKMKFYFDKAECNLDQLDANDEIIHELRAFLDKLRSRVY